MCNTYETLYFGITQRTLYYGIEIPFKAWMEVLLPPLGTCLRGEIIWDAYFSFLFFDNDFVYYFYITWNCALRWRWPQLGSSRPKFSEWCLVLFTWMGASIRQVVRVSPPIEKILGEHWQVVVRSLTMDCLHNGSENLLRHIPIPWLLIETEQQVKWMDIKHFATS